MKIVLLSLGVVLIAVVLQVYGKPNVHNVFRRGVKWDGHPIHQGAAEKALRKKRAVTIKEDLIGFRERDRDGNVIVPYNISDEFFEKEVRVIEEVMEDIQQNTCIRFERHWPSSERERPFIQFRTKSNGECFSRENRIVTYAATYGIDGEEKRRVTDIKFSTVITLGRDGCIEKRPIYHEILHSLGFYHEHKRPDRDNYVTVYENNIEEGQGKQFKKLLDDDVETHGTPYDFDSVMHYQQNGAGINGAITIKTHDPYYQDKIGIGQAPSEHDYQALCNLYKCKVCMEWKFPLPEHPIMDNLNRRGFY